MALASLAKQDALRASISEGATDNPIAAKQPHFLPKAKNIIYLFMAGGPSQLELFDYKPTLQQYNGKVIPESYLEGKRFAFMNSCSAKIPHQRSPQKTLITFIIGCLERVQMPVACVFTVRSSPRHGKIV